MSRVIKKTLVLVVVGCAIAGVTWAGQTVNRSVPVARGAQIEVENLAGSLVFVGWSSAELQVTGTLGDGVESLEIDVDEEDGTVYVEVEFDEDFHGRQSQNTDLHISLPADSPLSVETVSSSIEVNGLESEIEIETVSGAVRVAGNPSALDIENVSGKVIVDMAPADTDIESVSGRVEIGMANGYIDVENVSGGIVIQGGVLAGADLESVSGNIECHAMPGPSGDVDMETMSGTITLVADPDAVASYYLETFSGAIDNEFGPEPRRTSKYTPGQDLKFNTGSGGPRISLSSFSGAIKLITP